MWTEQRAILRWLVAAVSSGILAISKDGAIVLHREMTASHHLPLQQQRSQETSDKFSSHQAVGLSMRLCLVRHATLKVEYHGHTFLVDPMLDDAGVRPAIQNSPNPRNNPLVSLPAPAPEVVKGSTPCW